MSSVSTAGYVRRRFYKTRGLAAEACDGGKVEVNGHTAKPHKLVRVNDDVSFTHPSGPKEIKVLALADRRGSATEARLLYEDHSPPPPPREPRPFFCSAAVASARPWPSNEARATRNGKAARKRDEEWRLESCKNR